MASDPILVRKGIGSRDYLSLCTPPAHGGGAMQGDHSGLARSRFDTHEMDEYDARQAYLDRLDGILETEFLQPFSATMSGYQLGPLGVLSLRASARRSMRSTSRIALDRYASLGIQYVVSGEASGDADGRLVASEPGTVIILDYARPFTITDHQSRDVLNIAVPRALLPAIGPVWHGATPSGAAASLLIGFMKGLHANLSALPASAGPPLASAFIALLSGVLVREDSAPTVNSADLLIHRVEYLVDTWIGSIELRPAWIAAKLGISRTELYMALERFGGVARFILQRRLNGARAALENPHDPRQIKRIAFAFGFSGEAQFARAFRAHFGTTASDVRRGARIGISALPS